MISRGVGTGDQRDKASRRWVWLEIAEQVQKEGRSPHYGLVSISFCGKTQTTHMEGEELFVTYRKSEKTMLIAFSLEMMQAGRQ